MPVIIVTTEADDGSGLGLRAAVAQAAALPGGATIRFHEDVTGPRLAREIDVSGPGRVIIEGDRDGDGISDIYIDTEAHHFTVGAGADLVLRDLTLFGGSNVAASGAAGEDRPHVVDRAFSGADAEPVQLADLDLPSGPEGGEVQRREIARLQSEVLPEAVLDGTRGNDGVDGEVGGPGENGESAAGSIHNFGALTLERVGFMSNFAQGGAGGAGGAGGRGQAGGNGGDGVVGGVQFPQGSGSSNQWFDGAGNRDGGAGGRAGHGGDGGEGGPGGRGGDAAAAILNDASGTVRLIDVALGGRMANGSLTDQFGQTARAGDGGLGGAGGIAGQPGVAGDGAANTYLDRSDPTPSGARYQMYDRVDLGAHDLDNPLYLYRGDINDDDYIEWPYQVEVMLFDVTEAGRGGAGGNSGDGGAGGSNGGGGHAAMIVNYGTVTGAFAEGTRNDAEAGFGGPDDVTFRTAAGARGWDGSSGGDGGDYVTPYTLWQVDFDGVAKPVLALGTFVGKEGTHHPASNSPNPPPSLDFAPDPFEAPDGADGANGASGAAGMLGEIGQARRAVYSEGTAAVEEDRGLVYLTGLRQSDDLSTLMFSIVRVGDTSEAVTVDYTLTPGEANSVGLADFASLGAARGRVTFAAIDQSDSTFDADGAGVHHVAIPIAADGLSEGPEGFGVRLTSGDAALGTASLSGSLLDADLTVIRGTEDSDGRMNGTGRDDLIDARGGSERLNGKGGNDVLLGGGESDHLLGGGGNDHLDGGDDRDLLVGGAGDDTLIGGAGADVFEFRGATGSDVIRGFESEDLVDLRSYGIGLPDLRIEVVAEGTLVHHAGGDILFEGYRPGDFERDDALFA